MNIFYLSNYPSDCAKYHCDKHVVKMILEYTQLLCTAHRVLDGIETTRLNKKNNRKIKVYELNDDLKNKLLYSATHVNHPSAVWVRKNSKHYSWLYNLLQELHKEYTYRYSKVHKCSELLGSLSNLPENILVSNEFEQPPQAMPEEYKHKDSLVAYRKYYIYDKSKFAAWTKRNEPDWFSTMKLILTI